MTGRPPKPKDQVKSVVFRIRVTEQERAALEQAASAAGEEASTWARALLLDAARRVSGKGGKSTGRRGGS